MRFVVKPHTVPQRELVEVFDDHGRFIAAIYGIDGVLRIVSKHLNVVDGGVFFDRGSPLMPPGVLIRLETETVADTQGTA